MAKKQSLYTAFCGVFFALFAFVTLDCLVNNRSGSFTYRVGVLAVLAVLTGAALLALWWLWRTKVPVLCGKSQRIAVGVLLLCFLGVQLVFGMVLRVGPSTYWDFGIILDAATQNALYGTLPGEYFGLWGNNSPTYLLLAWVMRIPAAVWGTPLACYTFTIVLNCLVTNFALLLCYATAKHLFGAHSALFCLLCSFLLLPFTAYMPIVYTDTLTLVFPIGAVLLWLKARRCLQNTATWKSAVWRMALAGVLCALGAKLKFTVIIALLAIAVDAVLQLPLKKAVQALAPAALACVLCMGLVSFYVENTALLPPYEKDAAVPYTHWIMMGLHGDGMYYDADYRLTLSVDTYAERVALNKQVIAQRVKEFGPGGLLAHSADKLSFIFGDGTYFAAYKLYLSPLYNTQLHRFLIWDYGEFGITSYATMALQLCLLAGMAAGAFKALRCKNHAATVLRIAVFGLALFLLLWEARSRYLINFLPLMLLCGVSGLPQMEKEGSIDTDCARI